MHRFDKFLSEEIRVLPSDGYFAFTDIMTISIWIEIENIIYNSKPNLKRLAKTSTSIPAIKINVSQGDNVSHEKFGIGEIIKIEGSGNDLKATVNFKKFGLKNLLLRFAKLNKV